VFNVPQRDASEELPAEDELDDLIQQQIFDESQDHDNNPEEQDNVEDVHPKDIEDVDESDVDEVEDRVLNLQADTSMQDTTTMTELEIVAAQKRRSARKKVKLSKHGIQYPSLPAGVVKKLAMAFARTAGNSKAKISKETLDAIMQATDWFFEQVSDDLGAYAKHAGRKTIDESDIITLMAR
jgi:histone H3/H4